MSQALSRSKSLTISSQCGFRCCCHQFHHRYGSQGSACYLADDQDQSRSRQRAARLLNPDRSPHSPHRIRETLAVKKDLVSDRQCRACRLSFVGVCSAALSSDRWVRASPDLSQIVQVDNFLHFRLLLRFPVIFRPPNYSPSSGSIDACRARRGRILVNLVSVWSPLPFLFVNRETQIWSGWLWLGQTRFCT